MFCIADFLPIALSGNAIILQLSDHLVFRGSDLFETLRNIECRL